MDAEAAARRPTLAVFASEFGPGDPERSSIMSQAGTLLARRGARIVCLAEEGTLAVPLITSVRAAGGDVLVIADDGLKVPAALAGIPLERIAEHEDRLLRVAALATLFVGLPGSLASASNLFSAWIRSGRDGVYPPLVLLNRNRAFEVVRGMAQDVLSHSVKRHDRTLVFTDQVEDLWNKVHWALGEAAQRR